MTGEALLTSDNQDTKCLPQEQMSEVLQNFCVSFDYVLASDILLNLFLYFFVSSLFHCTLVLIMSFRDCRLKFWEQKAKYNTSNYFFREG